MYRRALSPYNSRVSNYLEALERDETVSSLRREYARFRSIQAEYDDIKYQITKAQREKKRMQQKNCEIQEEYVQKIQGNKALITDLNDQVDNIKSEIKRTQSEVQQKQSQNETLIQQIKQKRVVIEACQQENNGLQRYILEQQQIVKNLIQVLAGLEQKKKQNQADNKQKSEAIDKQFQTYKKMQDRLKNEDQANSQLKEELAMLRAKRVKLEQKSEQTQGKLKDLNKRLDNCQYQTEKLTGKAQQIEKQAGKTLGQSITLKQNIQRSLMTNKDHSSKLKSLEVILKESVNGLCVKHLTKQKLGLELSDVLKQIESAQASINIIDQQISAQENSHKGLVANLKKSIQSDEQAVKALTRKAAILSMISSS